MNTSTKKVATDSIFEVARQGCDALSKLHSAADKAKRAVVEGEDALRKDLSKLLVGKTIAVSGYTETEEFYGQSEVEAGLSRNRLQSTRVVVRSVFISENRFGRERSPVVYATYEEAHIKHQHAGGLSFRLTEITDLQIVEPVTP